MAVTSRLQELRNERGWTQAQLAAEVGVSRQTINSIETGRFEPSLSLALKLAKLFGSPVESIFGLIEGPVGCGTSAKGQRLFHS